MIYQRNTLQMTEGQNGTYVRLTKSLPPLRALGQPCAHVARCRPVLSGLPRRLEDPLWRRDRQDHHQDLWVRAAGSSLAGSVKSKRELLSRLGGMTTFSNVANAVAQGLGAVASSANYMCLTYSAQYFS